MHKLFIYFIALSLVYISVISDDMYALDICDDGTSCACACVGSSCPPGCMIVPDVDEQDDPVYTPPISDTTPPPATPVGSELAGPPIRGGGLLDQQTEVLPNVPWTGQGLGTTGVIEVGERVMNTIKMTINRFLGLLALIALVLMIWAGFKILIGQDSDYEQAKTTLKNAFFGILMIGISWLIVTFLFYIVCVFTSGQYCTS